MWKYYLFYQRKNSQYQHKECLVFPSREFSLLWEELCLLPGKRIPLTTSKNLFFTRRYDYPYQRNNVSFAIEKIPLVRRKKVFYFTREYHFRCQKEECPFTRVENFPY